MSKNVKELEQLIKVQRQDGWTIQLTNGGHYRWTAPSGNFFFSSQTPSDRRALQRIKQDIRRLKKQEGSTQHERI